MSFSNIYPIPIQSHCRVQHLSLFQNYYPDQMIDADLCIFKNQEERSRLSKEEETDLIQRIIAYYKHTYQRYAPEASGIWAFINQFKSDVHNILIKGDRQAFKEIITYPSTNMILHGFDFPTKQSIKNIDNKEWLVNYRNLCVGSIRRMAEATGAVCMAYPEAYGVSSDAQSNGILTPDNLVELIEEKTGIEIVFPTIFENEIGISTKHGCASYRSLQAIFQAYRIIQLKAEMISNKRSNPDDFSIIEIGGGTGRTAFYTYKMNSRNYTIVDLPITGVVQAYFLGTLLGNESISFEGEKPSTNTIQIISPEAFFEKYSQNKLPAVKIYDLFVNFDSFVEMSEQDANRYFELIFHSGKSLLSVNRESKSFTVRKLLDRYGLSASRNPYWLRKGYVEEISFLNESVKQITNNEYSDPDKL